MNNNSSNIDRLIARWLSDDFKGNDKAKFEEYLKMNPESKHELKELKSIWNYFDGLEIPAGKDKNQRWDKLNNSTTGKSKFRIFYRVAAVAAVFIIIVISALSIKVNQVQIETQNAQIKNIELPDQSKVILNSGSFLSYNNLFWFTKRTILLQGEAFFEVEKGKKPFIVNVEGNRIKVLGTSFNVKLRDEILTVACFSGKVKVVSEIIDNQETLLKNGEMCKIENMDIKVEEFKVDKKLQISWIEGKLYFNKTPLFAVFNELERFYNIKINYSAEDNVTFSGMFQNDNIELVLQTICSTANLHYSKKYPSVFEIY